MQCHNEICLGNRNLMMNFSSVMTNGFIFVYQDYKMKETLVETSKNCHRHFQVNTKIDRSMLTNPIKGKS